MHQSRRDERPRRGLRCPCRSRGSPHLWEGFALIAVVGADVIVLELSAQLRVRSRILVQRLCGLGEFVQVEVTLVGADAPVRQGELLQGLAFLDVVQHLGKARANSETEGAPLFHALLSTARRPAGRLGGPAAALRPPTAVGAPCG